jgi:hypothetical protein
MNANDVGYLCQYLERIAIALEQLAENSSPVTIYSTRVPPPEPMGEPTESEKAVAASLQELEERMVKLGLGQKPSPNENKENDREHSG